MHNAAGNASRYHCIDGSALDTETAYRLLIGAVVPRPVAWVTTVDAEGRVNVAPFSSYNYVATSPPMLAINIAKRPGSGHVKDTARNLAANGEFVVNVATEDNLELMHASAAEYPSEVSEAEELGIAMLPSRHVRAPRIACSPIQMECRIDRIVPLGRGINTLHIGEVLAFHLDGSVFDGRRIDPLALKPIARMGGPFYATLGRLIERPMLQRPPGGEGWTGAPTTPSPTR